MTTCGRPSPTWESTIGGSKPCSACTSGIFRSCDSKTTVMKKRHPQDIGIDTGHFVVMGLHHSPPSQIDITRHAVWQYSVMQATNVIRHNRELTSSASVELMKQLARQAVFGHPKSSRALSAIFPMTSSTAALAPMEQRARLPLMDPIEEWKI